MQLGPPCPARSVAAEPFLEALRQEAHAAGITRLAELTGLDRIGFPVWQAVRPAGRAQSVHQGKGWTALHARIGALAEALESHWAETVAPDGPHSRWEDLPPRQRCPDAREGCFDDRHPAAHGLDWCEARDLRTDRLVYLPHPLLSLDFTMPAHTPFERCSAGLAVGTCEEEAVEAGLLEAVERDAIGIWRRTSAMGRARCRVDPRSIPFPWFAHWSARIGAAGAAVRVFATTAIEGTPVCIVHLSGPESFGPARRAFTGTAAHGSPELALFKALAEALQSRLTFIAGARDDMLPSLYDRPKQGSLAGGLTLRAPPMDFARVRRADSSPGRVAGRLAALGHDLVLVKRLSPAGSRVVCVRVYVPGIGSLHRRRRVGRRGGR